MQIIHQNSFECHIAYFVQVWLCCENLNMWANKSVLESLICGWQHFIAKAEYNLPLLCEHNRLACMNNQVAVLFDDEAWFYML